MARITIEDCNKVLHRASWIPSYDEFASILELPGYGRNIDEIPKYHPLPSFTPHTIQNNKGYKLPINHTKLKVVIVSMQTERRREP